EGNGLIGARCDAASTWQRWTLANAGRSLQNGASSACMDANAGARDRRGSQVFLYQCMDGNAMQEWRLTNGNIQWSDLCVEGNAVGAKLKLQYCGDFLQKKRGPFEMFDLRVMKPR
ncbi:unnamed protein product, partial [Polarella glacialis]